MVTVTVIVWLLLQRCRGYLCGYCYSVGVVTCVVTVTALVWLDYGYSVFVVTVKTLAWLNYCYSVCVITVTMLVWLLLQRLCVYVTVTASRRLQNMVFLFTGTLT